MIRVARAHQHNRMPLFWSPPPPPPPPGPVLDFRLVDLRVLGLCFATHIVVRAVLRSVTPRRSIKGDDVSDVIGYNSTSLAYAIYCAVIGVSAWVDGDAARIGGSAHDRLYGRSDAFQKICVATAAYELYNPVACLYVRQYGTAENILHHLVTWLLALFGAYPFLNYYGIFFMGVATLSSVPLVLVEWAAALQWPLLDAVAKPIFALLFLAIRTVYCA